MVAEVPKIPAGDAALEMVRSGRATGLSVEFRALKERRDGVIRVVEESLVRGIGIVAAPSYLGSRVEARRRSGRTMRATIPAGRSVECRCSGAECKFAKMAAEGMQEAFDKAFRQFEREVVAGFGSYDMPLASASSGTLRGRILGNGDGEVEIDLPADSVGAATLAAHEAAGVIVRPHIDAAAAESTVEGGTRVYQTMPIRAFLVSATDAREGWPAPRADGHAGRAGARQRAAPAEGSPMAVTLTAAGLTEAVGVDSTTATRLLAVATELVTRYAPDAPDAISNEAVIRCAGWLSEQPAARDHERERRRYSDELRADDAIGASALRGDGAFDLLAGPPGGGDMTRRLALRRFPNEVVRRRQGPGGLNEYGEFEPGAVVETIYPARVLPVSLEDVDSVGGTSLLERLKVFVPRGIARRRGPR